MVGRNRKATATAALATISLALVAWLAVGADAGPPGSPSTLNDPTHTVSNWEVTPDGSTVVYRARNGRTELGIWSVPSDGSEGPTQVVAPPHRQFTIAPGGTHLMVVIETASGDHLDAVPLRGGSSIRLSSLAHGVIEIEDVRFGPDGRSGVYLTNDAPDTSHLWRFSFDGATGQQLSTSPVSDPSAPVDWLTPDGSHGVYRSGTDLFAARLDQSVPPVQVSGDASADGSVLGWSTSPDSQWVVYTTNTGSGTVPSPLRAARIDRTQRTRIDDPSQGPGLGTWGAPTVSADSSTVVFSGPRAVGGSTIWAGRLDGTLLIDLDPSLPAGQHSPTPLVLPDGSAAILTNPNRLVPTSGAPEVALPAGFNQTVSSDMQWLAYQASFGIHGGAYVEALDGTTPPQRVSPDPDYSLGHWSEEMPADEDDLVSAGVNAMWFSEDSSYVVVRATGPTVDWQLYVSQIGHSTVTPLTTGESSMDRVRTLTVTSHHVLYSNEGRLYSVELPARIPPATPTPTATPRATPPPMQTPTPTATPTSSPTPNPTPTTPTTPTPTPQPEPTPRTDGCTIVGTPDDDDLVGTSGPDIICGFGGDDVIRGLGGADELRGGGGNDLLIGGRGPDHLTGGPGHDRLRGGGGNDVLLGQKGRDHLEGGRHADRLFGNAAADLLEGGGGPDQLSGGRGADHLDGGPGFDLLQGGRGIDTLVQ